MKKSKRIICICISIMLIFAISLIATACNANNQEKPNMDSPPNPNEDASQTNNQTAGVDESDIVKVTVDGYIFKAQTDGITVTKANQGGLEVIVKEAYPGFKPCEMFVTDSLVIVLGDKKVAIKGTSAFMTKSEVNIYDVEKLKSGVAGATLRTSEFFGSFYTARLFENQLYVTFQVKYNDFFGDTGVDYFYDKYEAIKQFETNSSLAKTQTLYNGFILLKLDLDEVTTSLLTAKFFMGDVISDVYCSPYAIYIISWDGGSASGSQNQSGSGDINWPRNNTNRYYRGCGYAPIYSPSYAYDPVQQLIGYGPTKITKISLDDLSVQEELLFGGNVLNRYSLYDNGLVLFIASNYWGKNAVFSFDRKLKFVAKSNDFAHGEDIYSVRFDTENCYVVTFRQTDPLFKINISNPANMIILGELKIDGYSTHLQTFGDDYLMGLGYETNWGATPVGVKLVLFGVTENDPEEITSILFNHAYGEDSKSEATTNPKAILCEPGNNIFAFPVEYKAYNGGIFQGAIIFGVVNGKLEELAFLSNYDIGVSRLSSSMIITRITRIGSYLYTISDGFIASYSMNDFSQIDFADTRIEEYGQEIAGETDDNYYSGRGTENNPYVITTKQQLLYFANKAAPYDYTQNRYFALGADIDLGGIEWAYAATFTGTFDGNNFSISNFKMTGYSRGFFGSNQGTIKNLGLDNFYLDAQGEYNRAGGLVGSNMGVIINCYSTGNIKFKGAGAGGLVGTNASGTIINCYATGNVTTESWTSATYHTGGLVGMNGDSVITNSYATGNVSVTGNSRVSSAGGLVGYTYNDAVITDCFATGNVNANNINNVGGLAGYNNAAITNCYRYEGQEIIGAAEANTIGDICDIDDLNDRLFYINTLEWDINVWNFDELDFAEMKTPVFIIIELGS